MLLMFEPSLSKFSAELHPLRFLCLGDFCLLVTMILSAKYVLYLPFYVKVDLSKKFIGMGRITR